MKIDIWSDYICPFCTVGERHLALALENFSGAVDVEITWRSFQLDPSAPTEPTEKAPEYLTRTKGMSAAQVEEMNSGLAERAAAIGLDYRWRDSVVANTFDAHRVGHLARAAEKGTEWDAAVKQGFFTEGRNVADHSQLKEFAATVGLDPGRVAEVLDSDEYATDVAQEIAMGRQLGVQGVPFFVFDGRLAISGAQPVELFEQALTQAAESPAES
ncbi:MAG TPA: DsbA family oxidoreductase [Corynebacterium sp.]|nr:DsbA family oxidoreductase [Corynebacterium sp.]